MCATRSSNLNNTRFGSLNAFAISQICHKRCNLSNLCTRRMPIQANLSFPCCPLRVHVECTRGLRVSVRCTLITTGVGRVLHAFSRTIHSHTVRNGKKSTCLSRWKNDFWPIVGERVSECAAVADVNVVQFVCVCVESSSFRMLFAL